MDLQRIETLRVRAADGVATEAEQAELVAAGIAPNGWQALRAAVRGALVAPPHPDLASGALADAVLAEVGLDAAAGPVLRAALAAPSAPDVADAVMTALELDDGAVGPTVRAALAAGRPPEVADAVLAQLGLSDALSSTLGAALHDEAGAAPDLAGGVLSELGQDDDLGAVLRSALAAGEAPDVSGAVLAELGLADDTDLGAALSEAAGEAPDLWSDVAAAIGAEAAPVQAAPVAAPAAEVVSFEEQRATRRPWMGLVAGLAAAAAAVVVAVGLPDGPTEPAPFEYELAAVNQVEIEDISVGGDAIVQVLHFEEDAPTIIFIDVLEEPEPAPADEGATL